MSHSVAAIVGLLLGSLIGGLLRFYGYTSPPNWSALAEAANTMMRSLATWLGHTLLGLASSPTDPGRLPQLLLQDVNEEWGRCLAPDHRPIRPRDLVQVVTRLEYVIRNPVFDWESIYEAGIMERPVPQQDPVYWLPEGPLPHGFPTFRELEDPIVLSAEDSDSLLWYAGATAILLFLGLVLVWHSIPLPGSGDSQLDHPLEAELATDQVEGVVVPQTMEQPAPLPAIPVAPSLEDRAEPVPPEAESGSSEAQAGLLEVESEPLEAGPLASNHEQLEDNDENRQPDQARVRRHLIGDGRWDLAKALDWTRRD
ncbi:hypothetical protein RhiLY_01760 [Ceratobasidium sp. AG-Ba]|nr:hypothetical protein RhiLY_01760 [Ceratobasidium sp. AG-Ba]